MSLSDAYSVRSVQDLPCRIALLRAKDLAVELARSPDSPSPSLSVTGGALSQIWSDLDVPLLERCRRVRDTGVPFTVVDEKSTVRCENGASQKTAWFSWAIHPVEAKVDGQDHLLVAGWETTAYHQAVHALQQSNRRAELGMWVASLALAEIDYNTGLNHLSAEAARLFGLGDTAIAVPRAAVHATFHPDDVPELTRNIDRCLDPNGKGWFAMDHRVVHPSGEVRWLRVRKQVFFGGEGEARRPERAMLAAFDVTLEKTAAEQVLQSEQRFRGLAESMPHLVWESDPRGQKTYCNQRYLAFTGASSSEEINAHWSSYIHPDDVAATVQCWQRSTATGVPYRAEYRMRRYDGEYRHILAQAVPIRSDKGDPERWLGSLTEIHDQKLAENALRQSEKLAAAGRLAASVAHEINNPLASVTNLLYLLQLHPSMDADALDFIKTAQEELARVSEITTQMLRFHKQATVPTSVYLSDVVDSVLGLFNPRARAAGLEIIKEYRAADPVTCLASDLRQAMANLVGNAIEAMPRGGTLRIRLRPSHHWTRRERPGIRITIADTGPGIPRENFNRIFEAFFSTKGLTNTGLGLWITRDLIERCGGSLSLYSATRTGHSGTVFSVFIPLSTAERALPN